MHIDPRQALLGAGVAAAIAVGAMRARLLTADGAGAASIIGGATVAGTGWWGGATLASFFLSSSALSRLPGADRGARFAARGSQRDAVQVVANGGVAGALALATAAGPDALASRFFAGYAGAIATATADTWATELGSRFGGAPRSLRTGRVVPAGTSGAISVAGSLGAFGGAALIAAAVAIGARAGWTPAFGRPFAVVALAGVVGAFADSLLGATVQAAYLCPNCKVATERRVHCCGASTMLIQGFRLVDNDAVNFAATGCGAVAAALLVGRFG